MADGLFGVATGMRAYQDDQIKLAELASRQKTVDANVRLADAQVANLAADNARLDAAAKDKREAEADARRVEQALARIAQGQPADGNEAPTVSPLAGGTKFDTMLDRGAAQVQYLQGIGRVKEASELLTKLTSGVKDLAQARQAATAAKENEWDAATKQHEFTSRILSGVVDQASYDQARMALAASPLFTAEDLAEMPEKFDARFVRGAIAGSAAAKQKADLAREASRTAMQNKNDQDQINARKLAQDLAERTHKLALEREARLKKQGEAVMAARGDKPRGAPTPREVAAVSAELKRLGVKVEKGMSPALKNDIVEEVRELVRSSPMTWGEAAAAVVAEMQADGRIKESMIGADEYKPDGKTQGRALPLPKTREELVPGMYYKGPDGKVEQFKGFGS